jgi:predicted ATPase
MRLRYLELPRYGPLIDIAIVFGKEDRLFGWTPEDQTRRRGAINFVVGVNGTGKSSLLRAIFQSFRALMVNEIPAQPVTLAWDHTTGGASVTAIVRVPASSAVEAPWFAIVKPVADDAADDDWRMLIQNQGKGLLGGPIDFVGPGDPITTSLMQAHLPTKLVAYTSGTELLWDRLEQPALHADSGEESNRSAEDDRPPGWTLERELEQEQPIRINNVMSRLSAKEAGATSRNERLVLELEALKDIRQKVITNQLLHEGKEWRDRNRNIMRVRPVDLRFAAVALSLWQAAHDLRGKTADPDREAIRKTFLDQKTAGSLGAKARRVFNQLDWFWPTHLSFSYRDVEESSHTPQRERLLCLLALADEVMEQPRGRHRAVVSLGPVESVDLQSRLREALPSGLASQSIEAIVDRVQGCPTGAEAVMRIFSENQELDSTTIDVFHELKEWQGRGLLEDVTLTIKRLSRSPAADGELDDAVVTFDQLSDGEQVLLGRMGLLFLLRGQDGTLLLLDEPETHFNDVWKREMIDLIDDGVLKTTFAQVLVATHTSIALTDVFSSEIVRLLWRDGQISADTPAFPTFGADPGRILLHVFGSPDVIGSRAVEFLREKLRREWTVADRAELERLVEEIGSGWPRAKLAEILSRLDASSSF